MKVTGTMLDVQDGDAIILEIEKDDKTLLMIIDGGDIAHAPSVLTKVKARCEALKKEGPDIVACTHFDSDHIAGIIAIIEYYGVAIGEVWVHKPPQILLEAFEPVASVLENKHNERHILKNYEALSLFNKQQEKEKPEEYEIILESIRQLNRLMTLIDNYGIIHKEPIAGECWFTGWPEIKIIGPTREYYTSVFAPIQDYEELINEEYTLTEVENAKTKKSHDENPCELLKTTSRITPTNKASAIILIENTKKLLFTGDAGIESLENTEGYPDSIRDLYFLKVPHHGSNNNISKDLIELMNPNIAYNSGNKYEDTEVIDCLKRKKGRDVQSTKENGDLSFNFDF